MRLRLFFLLLISPFFLGSIYSQEFSRNYLTYGCGVGMSDGSGFVGGGLAMQIGYKRDIWKDRLRFSPNLLIGAYRSEGITDVREQYFNSVSLRLIMDYDIVRYKMLGLNIETGGLLNATRGLKGTGGEFQANESEYVNEWNYGIIIAGGLKIAPKNKNIAINLIPLTLHFGLDYFAEMHAMIRLEYRLK
ncbi:MAG: hypothetical protein ACOCWM_03845 [Cyclobacteriaceae bacterium]